MAETLQPTTTATVIHRSEPIESRTFAGSDVAWALGLLLTILTIVGAIRHFTKSKRDEDDRRANERAELLRADIMTSRTNSDRDTRELKEKFTESKSLLERELKALEGKIEHIDSNAKQRDIALQHEQEKSEAARLLDYTRIIQLESKFESLVASVNDVKNLVKEGRDEHKSQFDQLCSSIREISKRSATP